MNVLVVGGAGYIGSHVVRGLTRSGHTPIVLDNLSTGHAEAVNRAGEGIQLIRGSAGNRELVCDILRARGVSAVMHFAAASLVGESMSNPSKYWTNNVSDAIGLLDAMVACGVKYLVFSSTAAVYGEPVEVPITEDHVKRPTNTYGMTKLAIEHMLSGYDHAHGLRSISLRYFNAAGADYAGDIGEDHSPETHLIPILLQTALGHRDKVTIYGDDYPTRDGTCIRDYVHVSDLADAHILALSALEAGSGSMTLNLGTGSGFSVAEVVCAAEAVVGKEIPKEYGPRRPGDPAVLVADSTRARVELGYRPKYNEIGRIIESAWTWHAGAPSGYAGPRRT